MSNGPTRVKLLRERIGKSFDEVAALGGFSDMEYYDVEAYEDELETVLTLAQIKRLAQALGVSTATLFVDEDSATRHRIPYEELARLVREHLASGISQDAFEDEIGWNLAGFLESEQRALSDYGVDFLQALCPRLGINWVAALP